MQTVDDQPMETLHLYVVPENQLPRKRDYLTICMISFCSLLFFSIIAISLFPSKPQEVTYSVHVQGFSLAPMRKTVHTTVIATGKQYVPATTASGTITFYNGAIYSQIIPSDTIIKGEDGVSVITDEQATIPPASQTIPPTYGQIRVSAHSVMPGTSGNITAGDINEACCATSIIAQNASFHGGHDAYTYTFLSEKDVQNATTPLLPMLQSETLSLLSRPQVNPTCTTVTSSSPSIGKETTSAVLRITETCKAFSYRLTSVNDAVSLYSRHFGKGKVTHVQFAVVGIKGSSITFFVTAQWEPNVVRFPTGK
jgi:Baseplate J-like protein